MTDPTSEKAEAITLYPEKIREIRDGGACRYDVKLEESDLSALLSALSPSALARVLEPYLSDPAEILRYETELTSARAEVERLTRTVQTLDSLITESRRILGARDSLSDAESLRMAAERVVSELAAEKEAHGVTQNRGFDALRKERARREAAELELASYKNPSCWHCQDLLIDEGPPYCEKCPPKGDCDDEECQEEACVSENRKYRHVEPERCKACVDGGACLPGGCGVPGCDLCGKPCPVCNGTCEKPRAAKQANPVEAVERREKPAKKKAKARKLR